jgi:peptidoglycan/xylan/chitin deacetylase (PgdA/CDA1 family)
MMRILRYLLTVTGFIYLTRYFFQRNSVSILVFHNPEPASFERSIKFLQENYTLISLADYVIYKNVSKAVKKKLIITFDDGHKSNYDLLPIIKKYKLPLTIFLSAGIIGTNRHFWFNKKDQIEKSIKLKRISNEERVQELAKTGFDQSREYKEPQALSREQIIEMAPYVDFQSHTMFHPILPMCDDTTARKEIVESKKSLEEQYDFEIYALAYPNGDYTEREIQICKEAGYALAVTTESGFNNANTNPYKLKRIGTNDTEDLNEFILRVSGVWHLGLKLKHLFMFWKVVIS